MRRTEAGRKSKMSTMPPRGALRDDGVDRQVRGQREPEHGAVLQRDQPVGLHYDVVERLWEPIDRRDDWSAFQAVVDDLRLLGSLYA